jgi:hypothetical protein
MTFYLIASTDLKKCMRSISIKCDYISESRFYGGPINRFDFFYYFWEDDTFDASCSEYQLKAMGYLPLKLKKMAKLIKTVNGQKFNHFVILWDSDY